MPPVVLPTIRNGPGHEQSSADSSRTTELAEASPGFDVTGGAVMPAGRSSARISMGSARPSLRWMATVTFVVFPGVRSNRSDARDKVKSGRGRSTPRQDRRSATALAVEVANDEPVFAVGRGTGTTARDHGHSGRCVLSDSASTLPPASKECGASD